VAGLRRLDEPIEPPQAAALSRIECHGSCNLELGHTVVCVFGFGSVAWQPGSEIASRGGGRNETTLGERVSHLALTTQGILTEFVRVVTFKGSNIDEGATAIGDRDPTTNPGPVKATVLLARRFGFRTQQTLFPFTTGLRRTRPKCTSAPNAQLTSRAGRS
jgi:hypothetical protein